MLYKVQRTSKLTLIQQKTPKDHHRALTNYKIDTMEIPSIQQSLVYNEPGTVSTQVVELPVPEPGPGEVLIHLYGKILPL